MTVVRRTMAAGLCVVGLGLAACGGSDGGSTAPGFETVDDAAGATYEYVIPAGAGEALDAGEPLTVLPGSLTTTVGETIVIVNDDVRGHSVGPWFVGAGETLRQEFTTAGTFEGVCTVHPSGEFVLEVVDA